jgi:hypothetical protein
MITTFKAAGVSALLSAGLLAGFGGNPSPVADGPGKIFYDRVLEGSAGGGSAVFTLAAGTDVTSGAALPVPNRVAKGDRLAGGHAGVAGREIRDEARATSQLIAGRLTTASR